MLNSWWVDWRFFEELKRTWEQVNTLLRVKHKWNESKHVRSGEVHVTYFISITCANHVLYFLLVLVTYLSLQDLAILSTPQCSIHVRPWWRMSNSLCPKLSNWISNLQILEGSTNMIKDHLARDKTSAIRCTKCEGYGHKVYQCPNWDASPMTN